MTRGNDPCKHRELAAVQYHTVNRPRQPLNASRSISSSDPRTSLHDNALDVNTLGAAANLAKALCAKVALMHTPTGSGCNNKTRLHLSSDACYVNPRKLGLQARTAVRSPRALYDKPQRCRAASTKCAFDVVVNRNECEAGRHLAPRLSGAVLPCSKVKTRASRA